MSKHGIYPGILYRRRKNASALLCVIMILNALLGTIGMAHGSTHHHRHSDVAQHAHTLMDSHDAQSHSNHHDCCEADIEATPTDGCVDMKACAMHCATPLPMAYLQLSACWQRSYKIDTVASNNFTSIDPSRQFKPPRF